jgi:hypothetical protein
MSESNSYNSSRYGSISEEDENDEVEMDLPSLDLSIQVYELEDEESKD